MVVGRLVVQSDDLMMEVLVVRFVSSELGEQRQEKVSGDRKGMLIETGKDARHEERPNEFPISNCATALVSSGRVVSMIFEICSRDSGTSCLSKVTVY